MGAYSISKEQAELAYKVYKKLYKAKLESEDYNLGVKSWIKKIKHETDHHSPDYVSTVNHIKVSVVNDIKQLNDFTIDKL